MTDDYKPVRTLVFFAAIVALLYALMAITGTWTPRFGLDLQGGTTITLTARASDGSGNIPRENLETTRTIIQNRVDSLGVGEASVTIQGDREIQVAVPNVNSDELVALVGTTARLSFRPVIAIDAATPAPEPESTGSAEPSEEPTSAPEGSQSSEPTEPSPAASTAERAPAPQLPTEPPVPMSDRPTLPAEQELTLDEKMNYMPTEADAIDFMNYQCGDDWPDVPNEPLTVCDEGQTAKYLLGPTVIAGDQVTDANAGIPSGQLQWVVTLQFNDEAAETFADVTGMLATQQPPQNQFAIVLDNEVISAPSVSERIAGGQAQISGGDMDQESAQSLATTLRYGALPVDLETSSVDTVSATLGGNQLNAGIIAGIIGLSLVVLYCLFYYRGLTLLVVGSFISAAAVVYASIVLLGTMVGFALNLPGIAGIIVAVGMTADSFVIYFERIRDEIKEGSRLRHAIERGWRRARGTIIIADSVQILAAVVLYVLSSGGVKGFAFTLGITTLIDLFIVFMFTHPLMSVLGRTKFFGEGHKWSGFDPDHMGVSRASLLGKKKRRSTSTKTKAKTSKKTAAATDIDTDAEAAKELETETSVATKVIDGPEADTDRSSDTEPDEAAEQPDDDVDPETDRNVKEASDE